MLTCTSWRVASEQGCSQSAGCSWDSASKTCQAAFLSAKPVEEQRAWWGDFTAFAPSVVGYCEGVCYLRSLVEAAGGAGVPIAWASIYGGGAWGDAIVKAGNQCMAQAAVNVNACTSTYPARRLDLSRAVRYSQLDPEQPSC